MKYYLKSSYLWIKYGLKIIKDLIYYLFTNPKVLTLENIKAVWKGYSRFIGFERLPVHIQEMFLYRVEHRSPDCKENGKCPCNCEYPFKQLDDRPCERNCYPAMLNEDTWELYKKIYKITEEDIRILKEKYLPLH